MAATRFTSDSAASESSPTEPESHQATTLRTIVATAAPIDSQAYFDRSFGGRCLGTAVSSSGRAGFLIAVRAGFGVTHPSIVPHLSTDRLIRHDHLGDERGHPRRSVDCSIRHGHLGSHLILQPPRQLPWVG